MGHDLGLAAWLYLALNALLGARQCPNGCAAVVLYVIGWLALAASLRALGI